MTTPATKGTLGAGRFKAVDGNVVYSLVNSIARTDTSAKTMFTLPPGAIPVGLIVNGTAASDAATTAVISLGKSGTAGYFLNTYDVKTAAKGLGVTYPNSATAGFNVSIGSAPLVVQGIYAETGTASTTGGPWFVTLFYTF